MRKRTCAVAALAVIAILHPVVIAQSTAEENHARLVFSFNKVRGVTSREWNTLIRHADLVFGLDNHGYDFPGLIPNFTRARPAVPLYCFATSMGIIPSQINDWRYGTLDRTEEAFLHSADPASLTVRIVGASTRLFWIRDYRRTKSQWYPNPIGIANYIVESAPSRTGPWSRVGAPIPDDGTVYYDTSVAVANPNTWYRVRSQLADTNEIAKYSWPAKPDPSGFGFAYLKVRQDRTFVAGTWGTGPASPAGVVVEFGKGGAWGYRTAATAITSVGGGITEYSGTVTNAPSGGAWVMRLRSTSPSAVSMHFEWGRRNNRILDKYGAHMFKPDHPRVIAMHRRRMTEARSLGARGMRLDFVLDSYPSWLVATGPRGDDSDYALIKPRVIAMLRALKASHPDMTLVLNGISTTSTVASAVDFAKHADAMDCEFIGWSSPTSTQPFRDRDMIDGAIAVAHGLGKPVFGYAYAGPADIDARITSLARYWLVWAPNVYFQYMTLNAHQSADYFPEYDLDMGPAVKPVLRSRNDLVAGSVYRRDYANGTAFYNPTGATVRLNFAGPRHIVSAQGTFSPKQGGDGKLVFQGPTTSMNLRPYRGAIAMRFPAVGR